jgi:hypothetical protein
VNDGKPELYNGGVCPVCGDEFVDGFAQLEEGESYQAKVCIEEVNAPGEEGGFALFHLPGVEADKNQGPEP